MLVTLPLDENLSPRSLAALFAKRQRGGDGLKSLIAPTTNEFGEWRPAVVDEENVINNDSNNSPSLAFNKSSSLSTLMKKEKKLGTKQPKNHLKANREALKSRALANKNVVQERKAKEELQLQKRDREKQKRFGNVRSKIFDPNSSSSSSPLSAVSSRHDIAREMTLAPTLTQSCAASITSAIEKLPSAFRTFPIWKEKFEGLGLTPTTPPENLHYRSSRETHRNASESCEL